MQHRLAGWLLALALASLGVPAHAQFLTTDARRVGMGGVSLDRSGDLRKYNPAYRAVPARDGGGQAKLTIPIPLGLIPFLRDHPISGWGDDPVFNPDSSAFNPIELANLFLNPPLFLEVRKVPTPTNDVEFTIGKNELIIDLGDAQVLVPADELGFGGQSRLLDVGFGAKGFRVGVTGWVHHDVGLTLGDTLRNLLKEAEPATPNTRYSVLADILGQTGFAPFATFSGRVAGNETAGFYLGGGVRYYQGVSYGHVAGDVGFITGDTIFGSQGLTEAVSAITTTSPYGNSLGKGVGVDLGMVYVSGPIELGLGVNDIGATLTWSDTRVDSLYWDAAGDSAVTALLMNHVETKTELPVSYIANVALALPGGTTVGANLLYNGRATTITVGGEQRLGMIALRAGVARDSRKKLEFGWGGGLYLGAISLDVGFWTHSNSLSDQRGITMATSVSIY